MHQRETKDCFLFVLWEQLLTALFLEISFILVASFVETGKVYTIFAPLSQNFSHFIVTQTKLMVSSRHVNRYSARSIHWKTGLLFQRVELREF